MNMIDRELATINESFACLERLLDVKITILDSHGTFHTTVGAPIFPRSLQSHKTNPACAEGFCKRCTQHCRYEMIERGEKLKRPFVHTCWKGLQEVVVPLIYEGQHLGSLFAGIWRARAVVPPNDLSATARAEIEKLGLLEREHAEDLSTALSIYASGMLARLDKVTQIREKPSGRRLQISRFIYHNATDPLQISDVARLLNLSVSRTSHVIKELFGQTFKQQLMYQRIRRAKTLLVTTEHTIREIGDMVGIGDEYHFSRAFKKLAGMSPGKYRKENRFTRPAVIKAP